MKINELRSKIDLIDNKILELINDRLSIINDIGLLKIKNKQAIYNPLREKDILEKLYSNKYSNLDLNQITHIYEEIFSISRNKQNIHHIIYLDDKKCLSYKIAMKKFGKSSKYECVDSIENIFQKIDSGGAKYGVVHINDKVKKEQFIINAFKYDITIVLEIKQNDHIFLIITNYKNAVIYPRHIDTKVSMYFNKYITIRDKNIIEISKINIDSKELIYLESKGNIDICDKPCKILGPYLTENIQMEL